MATNLSGATAGAPTSGKKILGDAEIARSLLRIAHEVIERNRGLEDVVLLGIPSGGVPLAHRLAEALAVAASTSTRSTQPPTATP